MRSTSALSPAAAMSSAARPSMMPARIAAFRDFAATIASQVVEQLAQEFEREVTMMFQDIMAYRSELGRVVDLLGQQVEREKALHQLMETVTSSFRSQSDTVRQLQDPLMQTEKELHRIVDLLKDPLIPEVPPAPALATSPSTGQVISTAPLAGGAPAMSTGASLTTSAGTPRIVNRSPPIAQSTQRPISPAPCSVSFQSNAAGAPAPVGSVRLSTPRAGYCSASASRLIS